MVVFSCFLQLRSMNHLCNVVVVPFLASWCIAMLICCYPLLPCSTAAAWIQVQQPQLLQRQHWISNNHRQRGSSSNRNPVRHRTVFQISAQIQHGDTTQLSSSSSTATTPTSNRSLENVICLVTGASRGIGKGIALELGSQGATVYITGTSTTTTSTTTSTSTQESSASPPPPGTIEETAAMITQLGGVGIAKYCDHANDTDVQRVIDQIQKDYGRLDILVNNAFRLPSTGVPSLQQKFWKQSIETWDSIHTVGLRSHYVTTCFAMPLLFQARDQASRQQQQTPPTTTEATRTGLPRPLIVMIGSFGGLTYTFNVAYGVGKAGVDRMAKDMSIELQGEDICVVSLWPGVVNTERTQIAVANGEWDQYVRIPLDNAESPQLTGRAVVALAQDVHNMQKTGTYQVVAELAQEYGFTDVDGTTQPPSIRSLRFLLPTYAFINDKRIQSLIRPSWIPDIKLPFWIMAQGRPPE